MQTPFTPAMSVEALDFDQCKALTHKYKAGTTPAQRDKLYVKLKKLLH